MINFMGKANFILEMGLITKVLSLTEMQQVKVVIFIIMDVFMKVEF
jgi:hypothetical protein